MTTETYATTPLASVTIAAIDADKSRRPGVPMETEPRPMSGAHWVEPERQPCTSAVLKRAGLDALTPVFGTAQPPRGASGLLRRAAYKIPEHRASHWALLFMADRVDVLEHSPLRAAFFLVPLLAAGGGALRMMRRRR